MLSQSMKEVVANSSAIRAMFEDGIRLAKIHGAENIFDFSLGNPNVNPPDEIKKAIEDCVAYENPVFLHGYMVNAGYSDVREKIARSLNARHGTDYNENNIMMTVGAAGAINVAFKSILNPGDEVIVFAPFFGEYRWYIKNFNAEIKIIPNTSESFLPDLEKMESALSPRTKALMINSPNNPSGAVYDEKTLTELAAILSNHQKKIGCSVYLISDEPYREIVYDGVTVPFTAKYYSNTFTAYSFSKSLSLPGERIGYLTVPSQLDGYSEIWPALATANRILGFVNGPSLFQRIAAVCAELTVDISVYKNNRDVLYDALTSFGCECFKPMGTFYMLPKSPIEDEAAFCEAAKRYRLIIVPGWAFGAPGYFRIAYCVKKETVMNSLDSFERLMREFRK